MFEVSLIPWIFVQPDESKSSNSPQGARCKILGFRLGGFGGGLFVFVWVWGFAVVVLGFLFVWIFFLDFLRGEGGVFYQGLPDYP